MLERELSYDGCSNKQLCPPTKGEVDIVFGADPVGVCLSLVCRYLVNQWAEWYQICVEIY